MTPVCKRKMGSFHFLPKGRKTLASSLSLFCFLFFLTKMDVCGSWCYFHLSALFIYIFISSRIVFVLTACIPSQSCLTLHDPMDGSPPGSPVCGILQARRLDWVAKPSSRDRPDPGSGVPCVVQ